MYRLTAVLFCYACLASLTEAAIVVKPVTYEVDNTVFEGMLVYDGDIRKAKPGILMVPNWMGVTDEAVARARQIADDDYVVFLVDMYGADVRPKNSEEAGEAAGFVRGDRPLMRQRAEAALATFKGSAQDGVPLDTRKLAAIGFCFGGGTVLELGRTGADLDAIVSFHGDLLSPTLETDAGKTRASVLVLHGADDPYVPQADVQQFIAAMQGTDVDWQLVQFGNAVHSFTNPQANTPGKSQYDRLVAKRAYEYMDELFEEKLD